MSIKKLRVPLYSGLQTRDGTLAKDAKVVNASVEVTPQGNALIKRPGLVHVNLVPGGPIKGLFSNGFLYYVIAFDPGSGTDKV